LSMLVDVLVQRLITIVLKYIFLMKGMMVTL
jgi:hypothetical protein